MDIICNPAPITGSYRHITGNDRYRNSHYGSRKLCVGLGCEVSCYSIWGVVEQKPTRRPHSGKGEKSPLDCGPHMKPLVGGSTGGSRFTRPLDGSHPVRALKTPRTGSLKIVPRSRPLELTLWGSESSSLYRAVGSWEEGTEEKEVNMVIDEPEWLNIREIGVALARVKTRKTRSLTSIEERLVWETVSKAPGLWVGSWGLGVRMDLPRRAQAEGLV